MVKSAQYLNQNKIKEMWEDGEGHYYSVAKALTGIHTDSWITIGRRYGSKTWVESAKAGLPWTMAAKTKTILLDNFKPYAKMYLIKVDYLPTN